MLIETRNLRKNYLNKTVLDLPNLQIKSGEIFGLVGNNGAGKTTFFRLLLDLIQATEGNVYSDGNDVAKHENWKQYTGSYLDESFLIDFLTPIEFFEFVGTTYGMSKEHIHSELSQFEAFFNNEIMNKGKRKYIRDFSKGNIQKIGIAAAMLPKPKILILDEPFANLDPTSQIRLKIMLQQLNKENGTTILLSSHNLNHIADVSTRIVLLEKGTIIKDVHDFSDSPKILKELEDYFTVIA